MVIFFCLDLGRYIRTFSFEILNKQLTKEMKRKKIGFGRKHIVVENGGIHVLGVLRSYRQTSPSKRSRNYRPNLVSPEKNMDLDRDKIAVQAHERYQIEWIRP